MNIKKKQKSRGNGEGLRKATNRNKRKRKGSTVKLEVVKNCNDYFFTENGSNGLFRVWDLIT